MSATGKKEGTMSAQFVTRTTLRQLYADATHEGHLRGFAKNPNLAFPLFEGEAPLGRRTLAPALKPGEISVIRMQAETGEYTQSTTPITSGEVDEDLEFFLNQSDQIPTALAADVIVDDDDGRILVAGGILIQSLPDGDTAHLEHIKASLRDGLLVRNLVHPGRSAHDLARALMPEAKIIDALPLKWQCRCSMEKVIDSIRLLGPTDLAEMIEANKDVVVHCDLCSSHYVVTPNEIAKLFEAQIKARG